MSTRTERIQQYRLNLEAANTEQAKKDHLKDLLHDLFGQDEEARRQISAMSAGAEKTIFNIVLEDRTKTGRADTLYGATLIEWENDMRKMGAHAKEQLAEYVFGEWKSKRPIPATLIASDCRLWRVYAPHYTQLAEGVKKAKDLDLAETDSFTLTESNGNDFYYFLDRYLFGTQPLKPTLDRIRRDFGETSAVFRHTLDALKIHFAEMKGDAHVQTAYKQWRRFLAIAYGAFEGHEEEFLVHTYMSVLAKVLAYKVLTGDPQTDDAELEGILSGRVFASLNVANFIDQDFFAWVGEPAHLDELRSALRAVTRQADRYDFSDVDEDILKGLHEELIDLDTRHALGEYYTPDWLCARVVAELPIKRDSRTLDPACGSGSFLRATVARLRHEHPDLEPADIAERVVGIDIHPLAVQFAKATLLLALGPAVRHERQPVRLRVYLANTLLVPKGAADLFGDHFRVTVDEDVFDLRTNVFVDPPLFDAAVAVADELADRALDGVTIREETLANAIRQAAGKAPGADLLPQFARIHRALRTAKEAGRDAIWRFILQNLYKPYFLRDEFDVVVGNPPWLTYSGVTVADYQDELRRLAESYGVMPDNKANAPHLEIAAIFISHTARMFLKPRGHLAFVLPRSFLSADHHQNTRSGKAEWFRLTHIWDLDSVTPLFRVPACVLFAQRAHADRKPKKDGLPGYEVIGRLPETNATWEEAVPRLAFTPVTWYLGHLGSRTAFTTRPPKRGRKVNHYKEHFRQGATIVPRNGYFVRLVQEVPDLRERTVTVETDTSIDAKPPWSAFERRGRVWSGFLYRTAMAKNLLPFALHDPALALLPLDPDAAATGDLRLLTPDALMHAGHLDTSDWFRAVEHFWEANKTERAGKMQMTFLNRLDYQHGLTQLHLSTPYLVLYSSSAKDANAVVVEQGTFDRPFVVDYRAYWYGTTDEAEAHYLAAFLNADEPNRLIKDFQSRGLFGARDVSKTILDVPLPRFDGNDKHHDKLASLGAAAAAKASAWVQTIQRDEEGRFPNVGTLRLGLRAHLAVELAEIDRVLARLI